MDAKLNQKSMKAQYLSDQNVLIKIPKVSFPLSEYDPVQCCGVVIQFNLNFIWTTRQHLHRNIAQAMLLNANANEEDDSFVAIALLSKKIETS